MDQITDDDIRALFRGQTTSSTAQEGGQLPVPDFPVGAPGGSSIVSTRMPRKKIMYRTSPFLLQEVNVKGIFEEGVKEGLSDINALEKSHVVYKRADTGKLPDVVSASSICYKRPTTTSSVVAEVETDPVIDLMVSFYQNCPVGIAMPPPSFYHSSSSCNDQIPVGCAAVGGQWSEVSSECRTFGEALINALNSAFSDVLVPKSTPTTTNMETKNEQFSRVTDAIAACYETALEQPETEVPNLDLRRHARESQRPSEASREQLGKYSAMKRENRGMIWRELLPEGLPKVPDLSFVRDDVKIINAENAEAFRFTAPQYFSCHSWRTNVDGLLVGDGFKVILDDENTAGCEEFERAFFAGLGVNPNLLNQNWFSNHYRLIVWKLACYERAVPNRMAGHTLTPDNVMYQLKWRYDTEIIRGNKSVLKQMLEDDPRSCQDAMVLCVMKVELVNATLELLLTDGWYCIRGKVPLKMFPSQNKSEISIPAKLKVGTKVLLINSELIGLEERVSPLQLSCKVHLSLNFNSFRRTRWYQKLGRINLKNPPPVSLRSIVPEGGIVERLDVIIARVHPLLYRDQDGLMNQCQKYLKLPDIRERRRREQSLKERSDRLRKPSATFVPDVSALQTPEELLNLHKTLPPLALDLILNDHQREILMNALEDPADDFIGLTPNNRVTMQQELIVTGLEANTNISARLWWQCSSKTFSVKHDEAKAYSFHKVFCKPGLRIVVSEESWVEELQVPVNCHPIRRVVPFSEIASPNFNPPYGEMDVVGVVLLLTTYPGSTTEVISLADHTGFYNVSFQDGIDAVCPRWKVKNGNVICLSNVAWRADYLKCGYAIQSTEVEVDPACPHLVLARNKLKARIDKEYGSVDNFIKRRTAKS